MKFKIEEVKELHELIRKTSYAANYGTNTYSNLENNEEYKNDLQRIKELKKVVEEKTNENVVLTTKKFKQRSKKVEQTTITPKEVRKFANDEYKKLIEEYREHVAVIDKIRDEKVRLRKVKDDIQEIFKKSKEQPLTEDDLKKLKELKEQVIISKAEEPVAQTE